MLTTNEQLVMLGIARCGQDAYALSIQEELGKHGQSLTLGVLYTVLGRLARRELIRYRDGEPTQERGNRPKRFYALTGAGARELRGLLRLYDSLRTGAHALREA